MTPPLATVADLEVRLGLAEGSLEGPDLARAGAALDDVSALIRSYAGKDWIDTDLVTITAPAVVLTVAIHASLRAYRNPDGYASENIGSGAYGYSYASQSIGVYLTEEEKGIVRRAAVGVAGSGGTFSVRVRSAFYDAPTDPDAVNELP